MNGSIELVFKQKFENLSGPETFPVIITTLHNDFSLTASYFTIFSMAVQCEVCGRITMVGRAGGNWSRRAQRPQARNLFLREGLHACAAAPAALPSWEMSSICQDCGWHGLHVSRRSSPTPPRCCILRTFFPPCQLLPAP